MRRRYVLYTLSAMFAFSAEALPVRAEIRTSIEEPEPIFPDAASVAKAEEWLERIRRGSIDRKQLDPMLSAILTADFVRGGAQEVSAFGDPMGMFPFEARSTADGTATYYRVKFRRATLTWILRVDRDGQINAFTLRRLERNDVVSAKVHDAGSF